MAHPLDPLTPPEVAAAAAACRAHSGPRRVPLRFNTVTLQEPPKAQLLAFSRGRLPRPPRRAFCVVQTPPEFCVVEAVVEFGGGGGGGASVVSWIRVGGLRAAFFLPVGSRCCLLAGACSRMPSSAVLPNAEVLQSLQPPNPSNPQNPEPPNPPQIIPRQQMDGNTMDGQPLATPDDCLEAERIARASPRVIALLRERGVTDMSQLACDPWAIHAGKWKGRLMQVHWRCIGGAWGCIGGRARAQCAAVLRSRKT